MGAPGTRNRYTVYTRLLHSRKSRLCSEPNNPASVVTVVYPGAIWPIHRGTWTIDCVMRSGIGIRVRRIPWIKGLFSDTALFQPHRPPVCCKIGANARQRASVANADSCSGQESHQPCRRLTLLPGTNAANTDHRERIARQNRDPCYHYDIVSYPPEAER
jgi:hypothetical protein